MTIDDAIKVLEALLYYVETRDVPRSYDGLRLGIEALKAVKAGRDPAGVPSYYPLPGETEK